MPRTGRPPAITQDDILEVLRERDPQEYPVMTAPEITEHVDASRQTVVNRLKEMDFTDEINTAEVAGTPVWWPPEEEDPTEGAEGGTAPSNDEQAEAERKDSETDDNKPADTSEKAKRTSLERATVRAIPPLGLLAGLSLGAVVADPSVGWIRGVAVVVHLAVGVVIGGRALGIDRRFGEKVDNILAAIDRAGGPLAYYAEQLRQESLGPDQPSTPVERLARADVIGGFLLTFMLLIAIPYIVLLALVGPAQAVNIFGVWAVIGPRVGAFVLLGLAAFTFYLSVFAMVAIKTARMWARSRFTRGEGQVVD